MVSQTKKEVVCTYCKQEKIDSIWSVGKPFTSWRIDPLKYHDTKDKDHLKAVAAMKNRPQNMIKKAATVAYKRGGESIIKIMRNVIYVLQNGLPISFCTKLHEAIYFFGELIDQPNILPKSHGSNFSTYQFIFAMDEAVLEEDVLHLKESNGFTLHVDESTDIVEQKHLMMYITIWNREKSAPETRFLTVVEVKEADSKSILKKITEFFEKVGINMTKMINFTSDGAAVMLGVHKGVAQRLRKIEGMDKMLSSHCVAHREALALKDVLNVRERI